MNDYVWTGHIAAPLAIAIGVLACFWGYQLVKVMLGIMGFAAGAAVGWTAGMALAPSHSIVGLVCAAIGGLVGAVLCIWLFFFGIFLLGASAGAVVAAAAYGGTGHEAHPILFLACAVVFGLLALLLQKFMIVVSTAFAGSYLVTAGILHFFTTGQPPAPLWFDYSHPSSPSVLGYVVLAFWLILGLVGVRSQYGAKGRRAEGTPHEAQPAPRETT